MSVVELDGITAQYLIDSGVSERMRSSSFQPGGENFTDAEGMRWAIIDRLGVGVVSGYRRVSFYDTQITIPVDSDGLDAERLRTLLDTQISYGGRIYSFYGMRADAENQRDYGGDYPERWIELSFRVPNKLSDKNLDCG